MTPAPLWYTSNLAFHGLHTDIGPQLSGIPWSLSLKVFENCQATGYLHRMALSVIVPIQTSSQTKKPPCPQLYPGLKLGHLQPP